MKQLVIVPTLSTLKLIKRLVRALASTLCGTSSRPFCLLPVAAYKPPSLDSLSPQSAYLTQFALERSRSL